jgi:hypothetical protein
LNNADFSNAYIAEKIGRNMELTPFEPTPFYFVNSKDDEKIIYSIADGFVKKDNVQYVPVGGSYTITTGHLFKKAEVKTAFEYHYSSKTNDLFTYQKIKKGQSFIGTITANKEIAKSLEHVLSQQNNTLLLGGSQSAQYARCKVRFGEEVLNETLETEEKMIAELLTDCVIRDQYGAVSDRIEDLVSTFQQLFAFNNYEVFAKTVTQGGFNSKWKLPLPQQTAFAKGTTIVFSGCSGIGKSFSKTGHLSDFAFGCAGKYRLRTKYQANYWCLDKQAADCSNIEEESSNCKIVEQIEKQKKIEYTKKSGQDYANAAKINKSLLSAHAAMRTYSLFLNNNKLSDFKEAVNKNFDPKQNKELHDFAQNIINDFHTSQTSQNEKTDELFSIFVKAYLTQIERKYQQQKGGKQQ